ncbi:FERM domain-containing protein 5-like isoform X2 [Tubulanus polymorphus]|uniref:FERM domain-containing protein 5-like isoform X2 n=1 Tax=Tubulanus polymorphus TaxID=672921 RepID=UPI003DA265E1
MMLRKKTNTRHKKDENVEYTCTIRFLDDSDPMQVTFQKDTKGQWLLDYICKELNLVEKDYFGLRYVDSDKQRHWLDPIKTVYKQLKGVSPMVLCFRVKFYPLDPMLVKEEITRYFLFLQLRRDLHHGRLLCTPTDANILAAYIVQSEVGDYEPEDHQIGYVGEFNMLPKQTPKMEERIAEIHKTLSGQVPSEAESNFLKKASTMDTYGVDPYQVKDQKGNQLYIGVTHLGIVTFQGSKRTHLFRWSQVNKIAFEGKMFIVHITLQEVDENFIYKKKKHACGFKCQSYAACRQLWRVAVEQQAFFTLTKASEASKVSSGGGLFTRGAKFRFSGRCQKEVIAEAKNISREPPNFSRTPSNPNFNRRKTQTLPARVNHRDSSHDPGYESMKRPSSEHKETNGGLNEFVIPEDNTTAVSSPPPVSITAEIQLKPKLSNPDLLDREMDTTSDIDEPLKSQDAPLADEEDLEDEIIPINVKKDKAFPSLMRHENLDAQIESLQKELEQARFHSNHVVVDEPVVMRRRESTPVEKQNGEIVCTSTAEADKDVVDGAEKAAAVVPKKRSRCCSVMKPILITFGTSVMLVVFLTVLVVIFFELRTDNSALKDMRAKQQIVAFQHQVYDPVRSFVVTNFNKIANK